MRLEIESSSNLVGMKEGAYRARFLTYKLASVQKTGKAESRSAFDELVEAALWRRQIGNRALTKRTASVMGPISFRRCMAMRWTIHDRCGESSGLSLLLYR